MENCTGALDRLVAVFIIGDRSMARWVTGMDGGIDRCVDGCMAREEIDIDRGIDSWIDR
jgi:uncharacterized metal-binding protein